MAMDSTSIVPIGLVCLEVLLAVVSIIFLLSGLDDFFIDACHIGRTAYHLLLRRFPNRPIEAQLLEKPEQLIAIAIPAWDESAVIGSMLEHAVRTLNYRNYHIFVGTYPNDPETGSAVENVGQRFRNVHGVVCAADGPSSKADCLNQVFHGIRAYESETAAHFEIFVMHDAEDVLHALELKLFNNLIPASDMVQLPVLALQRPLWSFTGGHYLDEFAEYHSKDLLVRAMLTGNIPSAGTGTGFSRRGIEVATHGNQDQLFTTSSLTEDYDLGVRLGQYGLKSTFARYSI